MRTVCRLPLSSLMVREASGLSSSAVPAQGGAVHEMRLAWLAERPADRTHLLHRTRSLTLRVGFEIGEP